MNHYKFPKITHIDQITEAIEGKPEFIVADRPFGKIVNYLLHSSTTFYDPDPVRQSLLRECRGIVFGLDGRVIARRFHKFFNVGEKTKTLPSNLRFDIAHDLFDKLDGSMITPIPLPDGMIGWGTKMGLTDVAAQAAAWVESQENYVRFAEKCITLDITPIFEWMSRKQRIVLDYQTDDMQLLAIRENVSGRYWEANQMWAFASVYRIPLVRFQQIHIDSIGGLTNSIEHVEGIEGYVIRFVNGHMLKVKTPWYVRIHQAKDALLFEKNIIDMIIREQLDDVKQALLPEDKVRLETFEKQVVDGLLKTEDDLWFALDVIYKCFATKKDYALRGNEFTDPGRIADAMVYKMWGRPREEFLPYLKSIILKNVGTQRAVDEIRWMWSGVKWDHGSVRLEEQ